MSEVGTQIPPALRSFGRYELLAKLANGGMAELFLARHRAAPAGSTPVVIKRVLPHLAEDERFVAMFRDEARVAARIEHPNVCKVLEVGLVGDVYFMALEYLHGVPLSRVWFRALRTHAPVAARLVIAAGIQTAAGLHAAHELTAPGGAALDVVHRDVSPPNLFLTADGVLKVLDFGVVLAQGATQKTRTGTVKGKNAYMSPEQVLGKVALDRRSDIFSLGICLWEGLTGARLFNRDSDFMTFRAIASGDITPLAELQPGLPAGLVAVIGRCLARERDERYATAAEVSADLIAAAGPLGGPATRGDLAAFVTTTFASDLAAKDAILRDIAAR